MSSTNTHKELFYSKLNYQEVKQPNLNSKLQVFVLTSPLTSNDRVIRSKSFKVFYRLKPSFLLMGLVAKNELQKGLKRLKRIDNIKSS